MRIAAAALLVLFAASALAQDAQRGARDLGIMIDPSKPMNIRAEVFEAVSRDSGGDVFTFNRKVVATQEEMTLECDWLEAKYSQRGGAPERITARGSVRMSQTGTELSCNELIYESPACRVTCTADSGLATVTRGGDVIRGRSIQMNLCEGILRVQGSASIELVPRPEPRIDSEASE